MGRNTVSTSLSFFFPQLRIGGIVGIKRYNFLCSPQLLRFFSEERKVTMCKTFTVSFQGKQNLKSGQEKKMCKFSAHGWELMEKPSSWKALTWDYENCTKGAQTHQNQLKIEHSKYRPKFSSYVQKGSIQQIWFKAGGKVTYLTCTSLYRVGPHLTQALLYSNRDVLYFLRAS